MNCRRWLLAGVMATALTCQPASDPVANQSRSADGTGALDGASGGASESHVLEEIAAGVYFASSTGTGRVNLASNAMIVVNEKDVLVVDSHITADAARGLIAAARSVSDKPIRFLVNSHYHFDHAHGNQAFPDDIAIIGHEYTREKLLGNPLGEPTYQVIGGEEYSNGLVSLLEQQLAAAEDSETRQSLEAQVAMMSRHAKALGEVEPTPPNVTLLDRLTLYRGDREIQVLHLGRGHTGGDVVVLLPGEKIVFTGDLFYDGAPYLGDSYPGEFIDTLEKLGSLDWEVAVPGHGPLITDRSKIAFNQDYLRKYWAQIEGFHGQGLTAEQAADRLDLTGYEQFAAFQLGRREVLQLEVDRMYQLLEGD